MNRIDPSTPSNVITLCDYETCPTIKSDYDLSTVVVVKSDGNSHSIEAGSNRGDRNYYKSLENRSVGDALQ